MNGADALERAKRVKRGHESSWLAISNVVSIGIGEIDNTAGIIIGVRNHPESVREKVPPKIDGVPIVIKTVRELKAL
ncbi:MAG TPA: hypothetical protein ENJ15_07970 [Caldithrix abyssi]|uniref:Uncharacterized protein n=1 Tax=Caldithrix abyssi TaxID=187145 RepID=A0A7V5RQK2_CALAY|nr:hypothetical protein [Caldithrix abyssi]